jgi:hypothetical protein
MAKKSHPEQARNDFIEVSRALNNFVYSRVGIALAAVAYMAVGVGFLIAGFSEGKIALLIVGAAGILIGLFLIFSRRRFISAVELAREEQAHPNPLADALLVLDWVDGARLGDLASQMDVLPAPVRRERSRGRKRSIGLGTSSSPVVPSASQESTSTDTATYELGNNPSQLIKDLVGELRKRGQIQLGIADVPQVSIDEPLNENEIEELLLASLPAQPDMSDSQAIAKQVAGILGPGLPPARLSAAKADELAKLTPGTYVLVESEWSVEGSGDARGFVLGALHAPGDPWVDSDNRVPMPADLKALVRVPKEALSPRLQARTDSQFLAGIFGEVLQSDPLTIWPLAVFSRSPRSEMP